jgi:hypothetical protein
MAFTEADIENLEAVIKSGASSATSSDGKSVTYRPLDELKRIRNGMVDQVTPAANRPRPSFVCGFKRDL